MTRAAVVVGINNYANGSGFPALNGCVNDSEDVGRVLSSHELLNPGDQVAPMNMQVELHNDKKGGTKTAAIKQAITTLFASDLDLAVFYFSGHGHREKTGGAGYLVCADSSLDSPGVPMKFLLDAAAESLGQVGGPKSVVIILDCCHSGAAGQLGLSFDPNTFGLPRGLTLIAASKADQAAVEEKGSSREFGGRFTRLLIGGLEGGSANLKGEVTPAVLYAHIDQSLKPLEQRPIFATNIQRSVSLRNCRPSIETSILSELHLMFETADSEIDLDPEFEWERGQCFDKHIAKYDKVLRDIPPDEAKVKIFKKLQALTRNGLVRPAGKQTDMFWAAVEGEQCALTELGKHYWQLSNKGLM